MRSILFGKFSAVTALGIEITIFKLSACFIHMQMQLKLFMVTSVAVTYCVYV